MAHRPVQEAVEDLSHTLRLLELRAGEPSRAAPLISKARGIVERELKRNPAALSDKAAKS